jgi:hypothetical protein
MSMPPESGPSLISFRPRFASAIMKICNSGPEYHILLPETNSIRFDTNKFYEELPEMLSHLEELPYFDISETYSAVYHRFLQTDLSSYPAIRGQLEGPVSFGMKILDENDRPLIFNEQVREVLMDLWPAGLRPAQPS